MFSNRPLVQDDDHYFTGPVEIDEAYIGGKSKWKNRGLPLDQGRASSGKAVVQGMAQRKARGRDRIKIQAKVVPDATRASLLPEVVEKVFPASVIYTDEWSAYDSLAGHGYHHSRISHSQRVYVRGDVHTNTIEGFMCEATCTPTPSRASGRS
jgi:transposase